MQATMMRFPLTLTHIFERAGRLFPESEIVSRMPDKSLHRYQYANFYRRIEFALAPQERLSKNQPTPGAEKR